MSDAQVFKGGTPVINYGRGAGDPTLFVPPFGKHSFGDDLQFRSDNDNPPPFDAHYNGNTNAVTHAPGQVFKPCVFEWQRDNINSANPVVGDAIQMLLIPTNHWVPVIRFDVVGSDPAMAGLTAKIVGQRTRVDPTNPQTSYITTTDLAIDAAVTAQVAAPIPLDAPSSTVVWLYSILGGGTATADTTTGAVTGISGYVAPYYVEPEFYTVGGRLVRFQTGGLILGIELVNVPANVSIANSRCAYYLTSRCTGFDAPSSS